MADTNLQVKNANGEIVFLKESGAGTNGDPNISHQIIDSGTITAVTAITNALPAGTNAIGKLAANSGVDIGDVDVTSIAAGTNLIGKVSIDQATANANEVVVKSGTVTTVSTITNTVPTKGIGFSVQVDLTVDAGAYAIGDALGAAMTFANMVSANAKRSVIHTITLTPNDAMPALPLYLWLLNADLATPIAKNAAFVIVAADAPKILGITPIYAGDYVPSQTLWNCATLRSVGLEFQAGAATTSIIAYLVTTAVTAPVATHVYMTITGEFLD